MRRRWGALIARMQSVAFTRDIPVCVSVRFGLRLLFLCSITRCMQLSTEKVVLRANIWRWPEAHPRND